MNRDYARRYVDDGFRSRETSYTDEELDLLEDYLAGEVADSTLTGHLSRWFQLIRDEFFIWYHNDSGAFLHAEVVCLETYRRTRRIKAPRNSVDMVLPF